MTIWIICELRQHWPLQYLVLQEPWNVEPCWSFSLNQHLNMHVMPCQIQKEAKMNFGNSTHQPEHEHLRTRTQTHIWACHANTHTHMSIPCTQTHTHTHNSILEIPSFSLFRYLSSNKQAKGSNPEQPGHAQHTQASPLMVCQLPSHRLFLAGSLNVVEMAPAPLSVINTTCTGHKTWSSTVAMNLTTFFLPQIDHLRK